MDYGTKRTPARILILICVIWATSILISSAHLFPIFRDKRGRPPGQCHLIGNVPYTIISTVGAFYIPLIGMCIIYWKIFQAAKFRIRRKAFNADRSPPPASGTGATSSTRLKHNNQREGVLSSETPMLNHDVTSDQKPKYESFSPGYRKKNPHLFNNHSVDTDTDNHTVHSPATVQSNNDYQLKSLKKPSYSFIEKKHGTIVTTTATAIEGESTSSAPPLSSNANRLIQECDELGRFNTTSSCNKDSQVALDKINSSMKNSDSYPSDSSHLIDTPTKNLKTKDCVANANNNHSNDNHNTAVTAKPSGMGTRKKIDIKRERKATKVLGVVMGCFILCWLPFFIEETICGLFHLTINEKIISVLTWLGYLNSLLNPVIYTIFAPDFRQAFGKILFGRYRKRRRTK